MLSDKPALLAGNKSTAIRKALPFETETESESVTDALRSKFEK